MRAYLALTIVPLKVSHEDINVMTFVHHLSETLKGVFIGYAAAPGMVAMEKPHW
jgi:hypothetical protein